MSCFHVDKQYISSERIQQVSWSCYRRYWIYIVKTVCIANEPFSQVTCNAELQPRDLFDSMYFEVPWNTAHIILLEEIQAIKQLGNHLIQL
jgi:hypothetical protein